MEIFKDGRIVLYPGDCMDVIKTLPDNSIDSVVTDPPYALVSIVKRFGKTSVEDNNQTGERCAGRLDPYARGARGFMGKKWDNGETAFNEVFWSEVMRVLKPGGHMAVFGGTRTYHRLVCAIEDAGFEIRDAIMWHYGTGFPKSSSVSKQLDKAAGADREIVGVAGKSGSARSCMAGDFAGGEYMETAPATDAAKQWDGWGTALKPATEIICLARKPLSEKTVAANVLKWGVGAINVDGCRIVGGEDHIKNCNRTFQSGIWKKSGEAPREITTEASSLGRWPANLCLSWSDDEYLLRNDINKEEKQDLFNWLNENT